MRFQQLMFMVVIAGLLGAVLFGCGGSAPKIGPINDSTKAAIKAEDGHDRQGRAFTDEKQRLVPYRRIRDEIRAFVETLPGALRW